MEYNEAREFWTPLVAYLNLLAVMLMFLGIILAAWATAARDGYAQRRR